MRMKFAAMSLMMSIILPLFSTAQAQITPEINRPLRAKFDRGTVITPQDFQEIAPQAGYNGIVAMTFIVGADGRVNECRTTQSSGRADIDLLTCNLFKRRSRFSAATNRKGEPITSVYSQRFQIIIPPRSQNISTATDASPRQFDLHCQGLYNLRTPWIVHLRLDLERMLYFEEVTGSHPSKTNTPEKIYLVNADKIVLILENNGIYYWIDRYAGKISYRDNRENSAGDGGITDNRGDCKLNPFSGFPASAPPRTRQF